MAKPPSGLSPELYKHVQLIFTDLDGTLYPGHKYEAPCDTCIYCLSS